MRIRITYKKSLPLRFTSALDMQSIWERAFRRAGFHVQYSQGFHPQPKIQLGFPLPLGFISEDEVVDIWIEAHDISPEMKVSLQTAVPAGIEVNNIEEITPSIKPFITFITETEYEVHLWDKNILSALLKEKSAYINDSDTLIRKKRNGRKYDLRPLILDLQIVTNNDQKSLWLKLITRQDRMGRPDEVMMAMGFDLSDFLIVKKRSI